MGTSAAMVRHGAKMGRARSKGSAFPHSGLIKGKNTVAVRQGAEITRAVKGHLGFGHVIISGKHMHPVDVNLRPAAKAVAVGAVGAGLLSVAERRQRRNAARSKRRRR